MRWTDLWWTMLPCPTLRRTIVLALFLASWAYSLPMAGPSEQLAGFPAPLGIIAAAASGIAAAPLQESSTPGFVVRPRSLTVSAPNLQYSVEILDRNQREYVGVIELLEPLGAVTGSFQKGAWRLRFQGVDGDFKAGKRQYHIGGRKLNLADPFLLEYSHGLVPLASVFDLLSHLLPIPVSYQEASHRILLGSSIPGSGLGTAPAAIPEIPAMPEHPASTAPPPSAPVATPTVAHSEGAAPGPHRFTVVIDASHGGSDPGAALAEKPALAEKDVVLSLARRLRSALESAGVRVILLRDGEVTLSADQRAVMTNTAHANLYIGLHASTMGTGIRLFTALLPATNDAKGEFLPWESGQQNALATSRDAAHTIHDTVAAQHQLVRAFSAPLSPLSSITIPGIVVEIAPDERRRDLTSASLQQTVTAALAAGILAAKPIVETRSGGGQ